MKREECVQRHRFTVRARRKAMQTERARYNNNHVFHDKGSHLLIIDRK